MSACYHLYQLAFIAVILGDKQQSLSGIITAFSTHTTAGCLVLLIQAELAWALLLTTEPGVVPLPHVSRCSIGRELLCGKDIRETRNMKDLLNLEEALYFYPYTFAQTSHMAKPKVKEQGYSLPIVKSWQKCGCREGEKKNGGQTAHGGTNTSQFASDSPGFSTESLRSQEAPQSLANWDRCPSSASGATCRLRIVWYGSWSHFNFFSKHYNFRCKYSIKTSAYNWVGGMAQINLS